MNAKPICPFSPGDVVILNSSPNKPMTVKDCIYQGKFDDNNKPIFGINVMYIDDSGKTLLKGFPSNTLSLYKPVTDFIQPIGY